MHTSMMETSFYMNSFFFLFKPKSIRTHILKSISSLKFVFFFSLFLEEREREKEIRNIDTYIHVSTPQTHTTLALV